MRSSANLCCESAHSTLQRSRNSLDVQSTPADRFRVEEPWRARYHTRDLHDDGDEQWLSLYSDPTNWSEHHVLIGRARTYGEGTDLTIVIRTSCVRPTPPAVSSSSTKPAAPAASPRAPSPPWSTKDSPARLPAPP